MVVTFWEGEVVNLQLSYKLLLINGIYERHFEEIEIPYNTNDIKHVSIVNIR